MGLVGEQVARFTELGDEQHQRQHQPGRVAAAVAVLEAAGAQQGDPAPTCLNSSGLPLRRAAQEP